MFSSPERPCGSTVTADDFHVVVFHVFLQNLAADPDADPPPQLAFDVCSQRRHSRFIATLAEDRV